MSEAIRALQRKVERLENEKKHLQESLSNEVRQSQQWRQRQNSNERRGLKQDSDADLVKAMNASLQAENQSLKDQIQMLKVQLDSAIDEK